MFKKYVTEVDSKKLLAKALDIKKDAPTRLKHFKTYMENATTTDLQILFGKHYSIIYHTFLDTFSLFDHTTNTKQRKDDLECLLFVLEKILIYNTKLIRERWQFNSLTTVMQRLLHKHSTYKVRDEGIRLFLIWYQILTDDKNVDLQSIFISLVPDLIVNQTNNNNNINLFNQPEQYIPQHVATQQQRQQNFIMHRSNLSASPTIKAIPIEPLYPASVDEELPNKANEISYYLERLLEYMITQTTKPIWPQAKDSHENQELRFSFLFDMFKRTYLSQLFPTFNHDQDEQRGYQFSLQGKSNHIKYVDEFDDRSQDSRRHSNIQDQKLAVQQAIVIKWLTRLLRQDSLPGQEELTSRNALYDNNSKFNNSIGRDLSFNYTKSALPNNSCLEMEIARKVVGTYPDNVVTIHELFRQAFMNYYQPSSMKRVVNVYKELIFNHVPASQSQNQHKPLKIGYTSYSELLQTFLTNSSNAFLVKVNQFNILEEQFEMCKRIMNIYRFMVMKIFMNSTTWEQLLNVMLTITRHLFSSEPPEKRDQTISGKIAPAFFQTLLVSWIRANLYVHIPNHMWIEFQSLIARLVQWKELVDEWSTTMSALTRVLVKHAYGLDLDKLPLEEGPISRRDRPRAVKSLSTAQSSDKASDVGAKLDINNEKRNNNQARSSISGGFIFESNNSFARLRRCNSEGLILFNNSNRRNYQNALLNNDLNSDGQLFAGRKIKSDYLDIASNFECFHRERSMSQSTQGDSISTTVKESHLVIESGDHCNDLSSKQRKTDVKTSSMCVLLNGNVRGWTSENSVIMWRRMLSILGNINDIKDPTNHLITIECLSNLLNDLTRANDNLGISLDNQSTPDPPKLVPPYTFFAPWVFEATHLCDDFNASRRLAYNILCSMSFRRRDIEASPQFYAALYEALFRGLLSGNDDIITSIISNGCKFFCFELPGSTILVSSLVDCCRTILSKTTDRSMHFMNQASLRLKEQAVILLHSILSLSKSLRTVMCLKSDYTLSTFDAKSKVTIIIIDFMSSSQERSKETRFKALSSLTQYVYQELLEKFECAEYEKILDFLLANLKLNADFSTSLSLECELINLLSDHAALIAKNYTKSTISLISCLVQTILRLTLNPENNKENILHLLISLESWCISVGKPLLIRQINPFKQYESNESSSVESSDTLINFIINSLESVYRFNSINDFTNSSKGSETPSSLVSDIVPIFVTSRGVSTGNINKMIEHEDENVRTIRLACYFTRTKLLNFVGHFPWKQIGAASMSCYIDEFDLLESKDSSPDLNMKVETLKNTCILVVDETTLISFIGSYSNQKQSYMLIRNLCGRFAWDIAHILTTDNILSASRYYDSIIYNTETFSGSEDSNQDSRLYDSEFNEDFAHSENSFESQSLSDTQQDVLGQLLSTSSGQSKGSSNLSRKRGSIQSISNNKQKISQAEETMIALLTNQRYQEINHLESLNEQPALSIKIAKDKTTNEIDSESQQKIMDKSRCDNTFTFDYCRQLIQHMGFLFWEKRCKVETLNKTASFIRELKNLDAQPCRETHKIAVIYVAQGQEDKNSILGNTNGSRSFDEFTSNLGWDVNLASHLGFKGGLQANKSTGETSLYYCNQTVEVMFHVSTKMPVSHPGDFESLNRKLRHLGNDEIHIVWSEHTRDYRRGIIPTEFSDVIISIYPMTTMFQGYYRIQIDCKPDVPKFGPLFDSCIVHQSSLAPLIRATAINAGRAKRLKLSHFQTHFQERNRLIQSIYKNHKENLTFEDFALKFYSINQTN